MDTDIHQLINDVASQAGITIIADESVRDRNVSIEFNREPIASVMNKLALLAGGYWKKKADIYLISKATPESSFFREFTTTATVMPQNQSAATVMALLSSVDRPYVVSDPKSNLLSVTAPEALLATILTDIDQADRAAKQFVVEALVTEINLGGQKDLGFSWSWKNFAVGSDLSLNYSKVGYSDVALLKTLIGKSQAKLRANPRITAFEGREAELTVGQETYYSILSGNVNFPTAQVQLIRTGVTLKFTGFIGKDGTITLELAPEVSDAVVSVNGNPTANVRRASTNVRIQPGETVVIGGLVEETVNKNAVRIPVLGYLPFIGEAFTQRSSSTERKEVIIMLTPYLSEHGANQPAIDSNRPLPRP